MVKKQQKITKAAAGMSATVVDVEGKATGNDIAYRDIWSERQ